MHIYKRFCCKRSHASATSAFVKQLKQKMHGNKQAIIDLLKIQDTLKASEEAFHGDNLQKMSPEELKKQLAEDLEMRSQIMDLVQIVKADIETMEEHVEEMELEIHRHKTEHGHGHEEKKSGH